MKVNRFNIGISIILLLVSTVVSANSLSGKSVSAKGLVFGVYDNNPNFIWVYVNIFDDNLKLACPVRKDDYTSYVNIKMKDIVNVKGVIGTVGKFAKDKNKDRLFLEEGCSITRN